MPEAGSTARIQPGEQQQYGLARTAHRAPGTTMEDATLENK
jgi:hypothetical protein